MVCCKAGDGNTPLGLPTKLPTAKWTGPLVSKKLSIQQLLFQGPKNAGYKDIFKY